MAKNYRHYIRKLVLCSMFAAMAYCVAFVFRINVSFLTFDAKDAIVCIASMILGPGAGAVISLLVATIEQVTVGDTGFWGWLMDFASTATFSVVAGYIYSKRRNISGVAIALTSSVIATVTVMMLCNLLITPIYMKVELKQVVELLPTLLLPFNLTKSVDMIVSLIFIPSVFIYYNETALIHSVWYLVDSTIGSFFGIIINVFSKK